MEDAQATCQALSAEQKRRLEEVLRSRAVARPVPVALHQPARQSLKWPQCLPPWSRRRQVIQQEDILPSPSWPRQAPRP